MTQEYLQIRHLSIPYSSISPSLGNDLVIANINLKINQGNILGIVGPTGCGKTILLKAIAGLVEAKEGELLKQGQNITSKHPAERGISMVFQDYVLYPHMTAKRNILFPIFSKKHFEVNPNARLNEITKLLHITEEKLLDRQPRYISGGEKQRVAIGKAIAVLPDILLLDEPLSNIEANLRDEIRHSLRSLIKQHNITCVYVSHNQVEIAEVSDLIAVMYQGRIEQIDTYSRLFEDPKRYFVSLFIGEKTTNFLKAHDVENATGGKIPYALTIRPDECTLDEIENSIFIEGKVVIIENLIHEHSKIAYIEREGTQPFESEFAMGELFGVQIPIDHSLQKWETARIYIPLDKAKFFDHNGDRIYNLW